MTPEERRDRFKINLGRIISALVGCFSPHDMDRLDRAVTLTMHNLMQNRCIYSFRIVPVNRVFSVLYVQPNKSVEVVSLEYGWF